jgi:predicted amidohydrolase
MKTITFAFRIAVIILFFCLIQSALIVHAQKNETERSKLRIASCQFPVSSDISANYTWIENQMIEARLKKADIVHFPECALSGYPGSDMSSLDQFDWNELRSKTDSVMALAKKLSLWVILGSIHPLSKNNKPHNSLYIINAQGELIDRYDKRFCTEGDLKYFTPGDHFVMFNINGIHCGLLICYDVRFPELYREYRKLNCDVIFQSFYNARQKKGSIHPVIMPVSAQAHAATNYFYMSLTNSSAPESWPCYFITPDGLIKNKLASNIPGILISDIDPGEVFYDASKEFREDAMKGKLNSGEVQIDSLSKNRTSIHWPVK